MTTFKHILTTSTSTREVLQHADFLTALEAELTAAHAAPAPRKAKKKAFDLESAFKVLGKYAPDTLSVIGGIAWVHRDRDPLTIGVPTSAPDGEYSVKAARTHRLPLALGGEHCPKTGEPSFTPPVVVGERVDFNPQDLSFVAKAMSSDRTRFYLCGVHFANGKMESTDGHRLHQRPSTCGGVEFVAPAYLVDLLLKIGATNFLYDAETRVITAEQDGVIVSAPAIDGTFPNTAPLFGGFTDCGTMAFDPAVLTAAKEKGRLLVIRLQDKASAVVTLMLDRAAGDGAVVAEAKALSQGLEKMDGYDEKKTVIHQAGLVCLQANYVLDALDGKREVAFSVEGMSTGCIGTKPVMINGALIMPRTL